MSLRFISAPNSLLGRGVGLLGEAIHFKILFAPRTAGLRPELSPDRTIGYYARQGFLCWRFFSRTPGPPPFSSMNSTPAASSACRTAKLFAAVNAVCGPASSARRIVRRLTNECCERSSALHLRSARAALICELVSAFPMLDTYSDIWHY
jgi:hypothetical protein